jgi:hypothetical protein
MSHWTQENTKDFAYHLSLDFFTQLQHRFEQSELLRKEFAEKVDRSAGRISQIFNSPPENPKADTFVLYALALGQKVSIVAYDDGDPTNDKGPVFSGVFAKCWEAMGKPRDLSSLLPAADSDIQSVNGSKSDWSPNAFGTDKASRYSGTRLRGICVESGNKERSQGAQRERGSGNFNKAAGL